MSWHCTDDSPVLFRRTALTGELPEPVPGGDLAALRIEGSNVDLGTVSCIESGSADTDTSGHEDAAIPAPGQAG